MSETIVDEVAETPTGKTVIVPGEGGIPTITPITERTFPIRDIKLLAEAKEAFKKADELNAQMTQQALMLFGLVASAVEVVNEVGASEQEKQRLARRIIASTGGAVKESDVVGFNFTQARIILKPADQ